MTKESQYSQDHPRLILRETFRDEQSVLRNGGTPTDVTFSNGIATPSSGNIIYERQQLPQSGFSIRSIFKADLSSSGTLIADKYDTNAWTRLKINTVGSMSLYNDNAGSSISSIGVLTTNTWHEVVITNDFSGSSNIKFYVDGKLVTTNSQNSVWGNFSRLFDRGDGSADFFAGEVALVEVYDYVLTASEVFNLRHKHRFNSIDVSTKLTNYPNAIVNGGFDTDTDWIKQSNWTISGGKGVATACAQNFDLRQDTILYAGRTYRCEVTVSDYVEGGFWFKLGNVVSSPVINSNGTHVYYGTPDGSDFQMECRGLSTTLKVDNVSAVAIESDSRSEFLEVSGRSGIITDRWGATLVNTGATIYKSGEVNAMDFDINLDGKVDCGLPHNLTGDISIVAWIKPYSFSEAWGAGGRPRIVGNGQLFFSIYGAKSSFMFHRAGIESNRFGTVVLNEWQMVVVTSPSSGEDTRIYSNGSLAIPAFDAGTPVAGTTTIAIGNRPNNGRPFHGLMDSVRFYDGILMVDEISQLYTSEKRKYHG